MERPELIFVTGCNAAGKSSWSGAIEGNYLTTRWSWRRVQRQIMQAIVMLINIVLRSPAQSLDRVANHSVLLPKSAICTFFPYTYFQYITNAMLFRMRRSFLLSYSLEKGCSNSSNIIFQKWLPAWPLVLINFSDISPGIVPRIRLSEEWLEMGEKAVFAWYGLLHIFVCKNMLRL